MDKMDRRSSFAAAAGLAAGLAAPVAAAPLTNGWENMTLAGLADACEKIHVLTRHRLKQILAEPEFVELKILKVSLNELKNKEFTIEKALPAKITFSITTDPDYDESGCNLNFEVDETNVTALGFSDLEDAALKEYKKEDKYGIDLDKIKAIPGIQQHFNECKELHTQLQAKATVLAKKHNVTANEIVEWLDKPPKVLKIQI
jgi:hypothetical protein